MFVHSLFSWFLTDLMLAYAHSSKCFWVLLQRNDCERLHAGKNDTTVALTGDDLMEAVMID